MAPSRSKDWCSAPNCKNARNKCPGLSFFGFPRNQERSRKWVINCRREDLLNKNAEYLHKNCRLCAAHFESSQFMNQHERNKLIWSAVPTIFNIANPPPSLTTKRRPLQRIFIENIIKLPVKPKKNNVDESKSHYADVSEEPKRDHAYSTQSSKVTKRYKQQLRNKKCKIYRLERKIRQLQKGLKKDKMTVETIIEKSKKYLKPEAHSFFSTQLTLAAKGKKWKKWTTEEKSFALSLFYFSPKAYSTLRQLFRLPSIRCLQRTLEAIDTRAGFNTHILEGLELKFKDASPKEKLCCLSFDEMSLKRGLSYNIGNDCVDGFEDLGYLGKTNNLASHILVLMVTGLKVNWKQPFGFFLTSDSVNGETLANIVKEGVLRLNAIGLDVRAVVCDQCGGNRGMYSAMGVTKDTPFFYLGESKIYALFDVPHLLKSTRNNLLKYDFLVDKCFIKWAYIKRCFELDRNLPIRLAPKLSDKHFELTSFLKMRVKLAVQVLSRTVSAAMLTLVALKILPTDAVHTANFIQKVDNLFDCLNSKMLKGDKILRSAIKDQSDHIKTLTEMLSWIKGWQIPGARTLPPFVSGWCQTINGIMGLWEDVKSVGLSFLITTKLNQDCVESLFAVLRKKGGWNDTPMPHQACAHLKSVMVATLLKPTNTTNTSFESNKFLLTLSDFQKTKISKGAASEITKNAVSEEKMTIVSFHDHDMAVACQNLNLTSQNALLYVGGYLLASVLRNHKCHMEICEKELLSCSKKLSHDSEIYTMFKSYVVEETEFGGLTVPSQSFLTVLSKAESKMLCSINGILHSERVKLRLYNIVLPYFLELTVCENIKIQLCYFYVSCRIFWAIRNTNTEAACVGSANRKNRKLAKVKHQ